MGKIIRNGIEFSSTVDTANNINYDNSLSKLEATTTQKAIDEVNSKVGQLASNQIPDEYLKIAVDEYVNENNAGFATQTDVEQLSGEIDEMNKVLLRPSTNILGLISLHNNSIVEKDITVEFVDNTLTINGTSTEQNVIIIVVDDTILTIGNTYYLQTNILTSTYLRNTEGSKIAGASFGSGGNMASFTVESDTVVGYVYITIPSGNTYHNQKINVWLNANEICDYESPNNQLVEDDKTKLENAMSHYFNKGLFGDFLKESATKPIITWIDDDTVLASTKGISFAKQVADSLGIKCTFACITSGTNGEDGLLNTTLCDTLLQYQNEGFHICTHSNTHNKDIWKSSSGVYTKENLNADIITSLKLLREKGFIDYEYLVAPWGFVTDDIKDICEKWGIKCNVNASASVANHIAGNGRYNINRTFISAVSNADSQYYKDMIDDALINGDWLIFGTHSGMNQETGGWDSTLVTDVFQYAIDKGIEILPLNQAFRRRETLYKLSELI